MPLPAYRLDSDFVGLDYEVVSNGAISSIITLLYYASFLLLASFVVFLGYTCRHRSRSALRHAFCWLASSLLLWQLTLFLEPRADRANIQLWLGRINFGSIVFAVYLARRFIQEISDSALHRPRRPSFWLLIETWVLALLTMCTPIVDAAERIEAGQAVTTYGILFPLYIGHVVIYLAAALTSALRGSRQAKDPRVKGQLAFVALGLLAMGGIALVTNALLPYFYQDFRFSDLGTLSVLLFVSAVAYAVFVHRLFGIRVVLRATIVYGLLLSFVMAAYSTVVFLVTEYLTEGADSYTKLGVVFIAFSLDPLKRLFDEQADRLLFGNHEEREGKKRRRGGRRT